jgi:hypothetical protein
MKQEESYKRTVSMIALMEMLLEKHGNINLEDLIELVKGDRKHECPCCCGRGYYVIKDGWSMAISADDISEMTYKDVQCSTCNGYGYTKQRKKAHFVQEGWE